VPADAEISSQGITHTAPDPATVGEATHFRTMLHPLETVTRVEQLQSLPWPAPLSSAAAGPARARADGHHANGKVVSGWCECTLFEHAWYLRGMDNLFMDLIEGNGIAEWLLDHFTQRSVEVCRAYVEAGVDVVELGDDVGTQRGMMMSVDDWRTHLRPRLARVIDAIRDAQTDRPVAIRYHSDGNIRPIIDDLIEIGVDILNPVQPECMPADEIVSQYKDRIGFWGMVGTQTTMPFGTPQDVRGVLAECVRYAQDGAAIVIAPTHVIEPDVPDENIFALVDAVHAAKLVPAGK
jgi:uroporphyrinogen decarboxylase